MGVGSGAWEAPTAERRGRSFGFGVLLGRGGVVSGVNSGGGKGRGSTDALTAVDPDRRPEVQPATQ